MIDARKRGRAAAAVGLAMAIVHVRPRAYEQILRVAFTDPYLFRIFVIVLNGMAPKFLTELMKRFPDYPWKRK